MDISLPSGLLADYQSFVDQFNSSADFAHSCNVVYPPMQKACTNCIVDSLTHRSTNVYNGTGPAPFSGGSLCPWCNGVGYNIVESKDVVFLRIEAATRNKRDWENMGIPLERSQQIIRVRGMLADKPKLDRCEYLEVSNETASYGLRRYRRYGNLNVYGINKFRYVAGFFEEVQ